MDGRILSLDEPGAFADGLESVGVGAKRLYQRVDEDAVGGDAELLRALHDVVENPHAAIDVGRNARVIGEQREDAPLGVGDCGEDDVDLIALARNGIDETYAIAAERHGVDEHLGIRRVQGDGEIGLLHDQVDHPLHRLELVLVDRCAAVDVRCAVVVLDTSHLANVLLIPCRNGSAAFGDGAVDLFADDNHVVPPWSFGRQCRLQRASF